MYQRDRGELDWDQRSATTLLDNASVIQPSKSQHFASASSNSVAGYDAYLNRGPGLAQRDIELSRMDPMQEPLLNSSSTAVFQQRQGFISQPSFDVSSPPSLYHNNSGSVYREAPIHRPQERSYSPGPSAYQSRSSSPSSQQQHQRQGSSNALVSQQYPPRHTRGDSSNTLASPQFRGQSPAPQSYPPQQQTHARQNSGNLLASSQLRNDTSNPPFYASPQVQSGQSPGHQRYQQQSNDINTAGRGMPGRLT